MAASSSKLQRVVGWLLLCVGLSVFLIRCQHAGPYAVPRGGNLLGGALALLLALGASALPSAAFEIQTTVSPTITAQPIHVVLWVRDNVTPADEATTVANIEAGLDLWENVATSHIAFDTTVIRSATQPPTDPEDLLVIIAYAGDLPGGGASLPGGGFPGTWFGAVADFSGTNFPLVTARHSQLSAVES